eukprot:12665578-Alexandrium_andersonii.AAC.1
MEVEGARLPAGQVPTGWSCARLGGEAAWAHRGAPLDGLRRGPGQRGHLLRCPARHLRQAP